MNLYQAKVINKSKPEAGSKIAVTKKDTIMAAIRSFSYELKEGEEITEVKKIKIIE